MNIEKEILRILNGYQLSCVLTTANQLRMFDPLAEGSMTAMELADRLNLSVKGTDRVLNCLTSMGILVKQEGRFMLPDEWKPFLTRDGDHSMQEWIQLSSDQVPILNQLPEFVRTGKHIANIMQMLGNDRERMRSFIGAMHDKALKATWMIAREIPIGEARHLLDVGGGPGTYSLEWAKLHSHLHATIFDIPPVVEVAGQYIRRYGLEDRVDTLAGDVHKDDLGKGYDLVLLANILHMYNPELGRNILGKAVDALEPGGRIIIHGFCTDDDETSPPEDTLFNLRIALLTEDGRSHPVTEKIRWLEELGISGIRHFRVDAIPTGVITGIK